jgi:Xaa-Pro aminopeptidase
MRCKTILFLLLVAVQAAYAFDSVPMAEYRQRRVKLAAGLHGGAALIVAAHEPSMEYQDYRQDEDFFYLTGSNEPGGALLVIGDGPATTTRLGTVVPAHAYREILFLPMRNPVLEKYTGAKTDAATPGARELLGVDEVMPLSALPGVLANFLGEDLRRTRQVFAQQDMGVASATLGFTASVLGTGEPPATHDVRTLIEQLRMVKSPAEIALIQKATDASAAAQLAGMRAIKPGVRERAIAATEVATMLTEGCERASYPPIVGSGINSTTLHYSTNSKTMEKGDVVVIDAAGEYSMYASDLTRTMPVEATSPHGRKRFIPSCSARNRPPAMPLWLASQRWGLSTIAQTLRSRWTRSPTTTSTVMARISTGSPWGSIFCIRWGTRWASMCTTLMTTTNLS